MTTLAASERATEIGGELRLLARLLAAPPDTEILHDAEDARLAPPGAADRLEAIQVEYSHLFSVPGREQIPACQSVYTDELSIEASQPDRSGCGMSFPGGVFRGFLGQVSTSESRRWYRAAGYVPPAEPGRMADHASVQLDFLGCLILDCRRHQASERPEEARHLRSAIEGFRARFVDRWIPAFAEKLSANGASELYRRVGARLRDILAS